MALVLCGRGSVLSVIIITIKGDDDTPLYCGTDKVDPPSNPVHPQHPQEPCVAVAVQGILNSNLNAIQVHTM